MLVSIEYQKEEAITIARFILAFLINLILMIKTFDNAILFIFDNMDRLCLKTRAKSKTKKLNLL